MLAHQGGWDEILLVAGPIAIIAGLLHLAKKRVNEQNAQPSQPPNDTVSTDDTVPTDEADRS